jgi:hypothetical protein
MAMKIIRRVYVYLVALITLGMVLYGVSNLLRILIDSLVEPDRQLLLISGEPAVRRQVALAAALTVIGFPVWLLHWIMAERAARGDTEAAREERGSGLRGVYLAIVLGLATLLPAAIGGWRLLAGVLQRLFGYEDASSLAGPLAMLVICGGCWLYHWSIAGRDEAATATFPATRAATWRRIYLYLAVIAGLATLLFGLRGLAELLVRLTLGRERGTVVVAVEHPWWALALATGIASLTVGLIGWGYHWWWTSRRVEGVTIVARAERRALTRQLAIYTILLATITATLTQATFVITLLISLAFGEAPDRITMVGVGDSFIARVANALLGIAIYGAVWLGYAMRARHELALAAADREGVATGRIEPTAPTEVQRLYTYLVAAIGLGFLVGGGISLLTLLADLVTERDAARIGPTGWWREPIALAIALVVVGAVTWFVMWRRAQRWVQQEGETRERRSRVRRGYLALAAGVGLLMLLGSLAMALYTILTALLGVGDDPVDRLGDVVGWIVGGLFLVTYHGLIVRSDHRATGAAPTPTAERVVEMHLVAPPGGDVLAALTQLRHALPDGYRLEMSEAAVLPSNGDKTDNTVPRAAPDGTP